ncbi:MAG: hypothetical protein IJ009_03150 [Clostridia bacterium]|nr:hypothetical protein [Clostridia bacterium]
MKLKKICKSFLYPPTALLLVFVPVATVFLIYSMVFLGSEATTSYISYAFAAYTLTILCLRTPAIIAFFRQFKGNNRYIRVWLENAHLRTKASLYAALLFNTAYAVLQLGLGFYHASFWFYSLSAYYLLLAVVRFFLLRRMAENGGSREAELRAFRATGQFLLWMNLALSLIIFFMIYWGRTFHHHEITTIAMAAYTFTSFTVAIVNLVRYRRYKSPVFSASKVIGLAAACVSMLTLESTMLTTFGEEQDATFRLIMLGTTGAAVSLFLIIMAIFMILRGTRELRLLQKESSHGEQTR